MENNDNSEPETPLGSQFTFEELGYMMRAHTLSTRHHRHHRHILNTMGSCRVSQGALFSMKFAKCLLKKLLLNDIKNIRFRRQGTYITVPLYIGDYRTIISFIYNNIMDVRSNVTDEPIPTATKDSLSVGNYYGRNIPSGMKDYQELRTITDQEIDAMFTEGKLCAMGLKRPDRENTPNENIPHFYTLEIVNSTRGIIHNANSDDDLLSPFVSKSVTKALFIMYIRTETLFKAMQIAYGNKELAISHTPVISVMVSSDNGFNSALELCKNPIHTKQNIDELKGSEHNLLLDYNRCIAELGITPVISHQSLYKTIQFFRICFNEKYFFSGLIQPTARNQNTERRQFPLIQIGRNRANKLYEHFITIYSSNAYKIYLNAAIKFCYDYFRILHPDNRKLQIGLNVCYSNHYHNLTGKDGEELEDYLAQEIVLTKTAKKIMEESTQDSIPASAAARAAAEGGGRTRRKNIRKRKTFKRKNTKKLKAKKR